MSLKIPDTARKVFHITGITLAVLLAACLIRVAIWEHFYYDEKEGSPRASAASPERTPAAQSVVDEAIITEEVKQDYIVAPDKPRYLSIAKLGISNARILEVSANAGEAMGTPTNIFDVGWAVTSARPGTGGTLLMDGHNSGTSKDGVFNNLYKLRPGDHITIERGDGLLFTYAVYDVKTLTLSEADAYMKTLQTSPIPSRESLSIITCIGQWITSAATYDSRVMLRATLVE